MSSSKQQDYLSRLPPEVIHEIRAYLAHRSLRAFSQTCKQIRKVMDPFILAWRSERSTKYGKILIGPTKAPGHPSLAEKERYRNLVLACDKGDIKGVESILRDGVSAEEPNGLCLDQPYGSWTASPLDASVWRNNVQLVRRLFAAGVKVPKHAQCLKLLFCTGNPSQEMLDLLNEGAKGIDFNYRADDILHWACQKGCSIAAIANLIHHHKLDVRRTFSDPVKYSGSTPLELVLSRRQDRGSSQYYDVVRLICGVPDYINTLSPKGHSPLHEAIRRRDTEVVRIMLQEFGADPNAKTAGGVSPLLMALRFKVISLDIVELLVEAGATLGDSHWDLCDFSRLCHLFKDPTQGGANSARVGAILEKLVFNIDVHKSPNALIIIAVIQDDLALLDKACLLSKKQTSAWSQRHRRKLLDLAAELDRWNAFELLLSHVEAPVLSNSRSQLGPFIDCVLRRAPPRALHALLLWQPDVLLYKRWAMSFATKYQDLTILLFVLDHINEPSEDFLEESLRVAVRHGGEETVAMLLGKLGLANGGIKRLNLSVDFALEAAKRGSAAILALLLSYGCSINKSSEGTSTPLIFASENGHLEVVALLLKRGADVNGQDWYGRTALYFAADRGHEGIVRLLLQAGSDTELCSSTGTTALSRAVDAGHGAIVQALLEAGASLLDPGERDIYLLHSAAERGNIPIAKCLLQFGAEIEYQDFLKRTALHYAASEGNLDAVKVLVNAGAALDTANKYECTALIEAAMNGHLDVVDFLIKVVAAVDITDWHDHSALRHAVQRRHHRVARLLLDAKAVPNNPGAICRPALSIAASNGRVSMVKLLLQSGAAVDATDKKGKTALFETLSKIRRVLRARFECPFRHWNKKDHAKWKSDMKRIVNLVNAARILLEHSAKWEDVPEFPESETPWLPRNRNEGYDENFTSAFLRYIRDGPSAFECTAEGTGQRLLTQMVARDHTGLVSILKFVGCNMYQPDAEGKTALHFARSDEMMRVLYSSHRAQEGWEPGCHDQIYWVAKHNFALK